MSVSEPYDIPLQADIGTKSVSETYDTALQEIPATSVSEPYEIGPQSLGAQVSEPYEQDLAAYSGGVDGSLIRKVSIPPNSHEEDSILTKDMAPLSVTQDEIALAAVSPSKLDRAYQEAFSTLTVSADKFKDISGVTPPVSQVVNDEDVLAFEKGSPKETSGARFSIEVPDDYNEEKTISLLLRISGSTGESNNFRVQTDYRKNGGGLQGTEDISIAPPASADIHEPIEVRTFIAGEVKAGDGLAVLVKRLGADVLDTHSGDMQLVRAILRYGV